MSSRPSTVALTHILFEEQHFSIDDVANKMMSLPQEVVATAVSSLMKLHPELVMTFMTMLHSEEAAASRRLESQSVVSTGNTFVIRPQEQLYEAASAPVHLQQVEGQQQRVVHVAPVSRLQLPSRPFVPNVQSGAASTTATRQRVATLAVKARIPPDEAEALVAIAELHFAGGVAPFRSMAEWPTGVVKPLAGFVFFCNNKVSALAPCGKRRRITCQTHALSTCSGHYADICRVHRSQVVRHAK